jgi:hypothetical protein
MNAAFPVPMGRISVPELVEFTSAMITPPTLNESLPVNDISDQIREAVLNLQRDLDRVTARVRSLEVSALSGSIQRVSDHELRNYSVLPEKVIDVDLFNNLVIHN